MEQILSLVPFLALDAKAIQDTMPSFLVLLFSASMALGGLYLLLGPILARKKKRIFYAKGAKQMGLLSLLIGWPLVVGVKACLYLSGSSFLPTNITELSLDVGWLLLLFTTLLQTFVLLLWRAFENHPRLQGTLAFFACLQGLITSIYGIALLRILSTLDPLPALPKLISLLSALLIPQTTSLAFIGGCGIVLFFFAAPCFYATIGLLFLRSYQDFGRDHYTQVICVLLSVARWTLALLCVLLLVHFASCFSLDPAKGYFELTLSGSALLSFVLLRFVQKSAVPLRHKFLLFLGNLMALVLFYLCFIFWIG